MADPLILDLYLKTLCPVHIGCDEVYEPTGFVIDENEACLISFDTERLLENMGNAKRKEFMTICREGTVTSLLKIYRFFSSYHSREKIKGQKIKVCKGLIKHYQNTLRLPQNNERRVIQELNNFAIARTAYDPQSNQPYIPGSSIKGAIRTAFLNLRQQRLNIPKEKDAKALEKRLLGDFRNFDEDPFRLLKVSDFFPLQNTVTQIIYVINKKRRPSSFESRGLPLILEVAPAGTLFKGTIRLEQPPSRAVVAEPINLKDMVQSLSQFYRKEKTLEDNDLKAIGVISEPLNTDEWPVRIGRHSGAQCVTIEDHRSIKILGAKGSPTRYLQETTTFWLASAEKNPVSNSNLVPMGWAVFGAMTPELRKEFESKEAPISDIETISQNTETPDPTAREILYENWEKATLEFNPGRSSVKVTTVGKTAEFKDRSLVPEALHNTLFKKRKRVTANVKVEVESSVYFKVVEVSMP